MTELIRTLVADDHPLFREGVVHSLGIEPRFQVVAQAGSGEEALQQLKTMQPDLVLLDMSMPGLSGIETARRMAEIAPATRIMMLTVDDRGPSLLAALKAGAHGYVLKGVAAQELREIALRIADGEAYVPPALAAELLSELSAPRRADVLSTLTPREVSVLELLGQALSNRAIGEQLFISEKTVKRHMTAILAKLQVRSRTEAALLAAQHGRAEHSP